MVRGILVTVTKIACHLPWLGVKLIYFQEKLTINF